MAASGTVDAVNRPSDASPVDSVDQVACSSFDATGTDEVVSSPNPEPSTVPGCMVLDHYTRGIVVDVSRHAV
jgi:hypothetical protein